MQALARCIERILECEKLRRCRKKCDESITIGGNVSEMTFCSQLVIDIDDKEKPEAGMLFVVSCEVVTGRR